MKDLTITLRSCTNTDTQQHPPNRRKISEKEMVMLNLSGSMPKTLKCHPNTFLCVKDLNTTFSDSFNELLQQDKERQRERDRETERDRQTDRNRERQRQRETEKERDRNRERDRQTDRQIDRHRERERVKERETKTKRERQR